MSTAVDVATACNLTVRRVQQLAKDGILPRQVPGAYDLMACLLAYVRYLQAAMTAKSAMDGTGRISNTNQQRGKMLDVGVALEELKLAKARGEVLSIADHEAILSTLVIETKATLMAVGPRVAPRIVGETNRAAIQAAIDAGQKEAMMKLSLFAPAARPTKKAVKAPAPAPAALAIAAPLQAARQELGVLLAGLLEARRSSPSMPAPSRAVRGHRGRRRPTRI